MLNVLLDELPSEWNGYPIDTDFQTGIMIMQCLSDVDLKKEERIYVALNLLFPDKNNVPKAEEAVQCLNWYMNGFNHDKHSKKKKDKVKAMDFDIDQWRIYAAFLSQYGIDLNTAKMHWFVFMGLLSNLEECAFTRVVDIRLKKITGKMSEEQKSAIREAKRIYTIEQEMTEEEKEIEQEATEEFLRMLGMK